MNEDAIDISDLVEQLCERLGVKASYVYRVEIDAGGDATLHMYKGRDGRCEGPKLVEATPDGRMAATETVAVPVIA